MKLWFMKKTITLITVLLTLTSSGTFASGDDANDPNNYNFIWVVALEKEPNDTYWNPTLYKINIEEAKVVERKKITEQGAPVFCYSLLGNRIRVILSEGVAANGTSVGQEITIDLTIDKNTMSILKRKTEMGYNDYQEYKKIVLSDKNKKLNIDKPKQLVKKKGEVFLGTSKIRPWAFMLKGFFINKSNLSLEILDSNSLTPMESIPLSVGDRKLGGFFGVEWGDATYIVERYVLCLFPGKSPLGTFAPGYIMIVDTELKTVKYVAIGSDPARGIAY